MKKEHWLVAAFVLALIVTLFLEAQSLFVYPCPDTAMWLGDESWKMLAARGLFSTGHPVIPEAIGSTLAKGTGLVSGSSWITTILYGLPAALSSLNPVDIGRVITLIISILLLASLYLITTKEGVGRTLVLAGLLALSLSTFFVIESHSARSDSITGLAVIGFLSILNGYYKQSRPHHYFMAGLLWAASPIIYIHVITLTALSYGFFLYKTKVWQSKQLIGLTALGLLCGVALVVIPYIITTGSLQFFGPTSGKHVQYNDVVSSLPLMHLTSPSALKATVLARASHWIELGLPLLILAVVALITAPFTSRVKRTDILVSSSLLVIASSLLVQGDAVFYMAHIGPTILLVTLLLLNPLSKYLQLWTLVFVIPLVVYGNIYYLRQAAIGRSLVNQNRTVVSSLLSYIRTDAKPLVVTDQASTYYALSDTNVRVMTNHFLYFPSADYDTILARAKPNYMLLYPLSDYIRTFARDHGTLIAERSAVLSELKVFVMHSPQPDTVSLYRYE